MTDLGGNEAGPPGARCPHSASSPGATPCVGQGSDALRPGSGCHLAVQAPEAEPIFFILPQATGGGRDLCPSSLPLQRLCWGLALHPSDLPQVEGPPGPGPEEAHCGRSCRSVCRQTGQSGAVWPADGGGLAMAVQLPSYIPPNISLPPFCSRPSLQER